MSSWKKERMITIFVTRQYIQVYTYTLADKNGKVGNITIQRAFFVLPLENRYYVMSSRRKIAVIGRESDRSPVKVTGF